MLDIKCLNRENPGPYYANMILAQARELNDYHILPSCGDDSLDLETGLYIAANYRADKVIPLKENYFRYQIIKSELKKVLNKLRNKIAYIRAKKIKKKAVELIAKNQIVSWIKTL